MESATATYAVAAAIDLLTVSLTHAAALFLFLAGGAAAFKIRSRTL